MTRFDPQDPRPVPIDSRFRTASGYSLAVKTISIDELKRNLSSLVDEAAAGARICVDTSAYLCLLLGEAGWQRLAGEVDVPQNLAARELGLPV